MAVNSVKLIGRLTKDPSTLLKQLSEDKSVMTVSIAVQKGKSKEDVDYFPIVVWGKQAENLAKYKKQGDEICVDGRLTNRSYEKDGMKITVTEVVANSYNGVTYLRDSKKNNSNTLVENETEYNNYNSVENETNTDNNSSDFSGVGGNFLASNNSEFANMGW